MECFEKRLRNTIVDNYLNLQLCESSIDFCMDLHRLVDKYKPENMTQEKYNNLAIQIYFEVRDSIDKNI